MPDPGRTPAPEATRDSATEATRDPGPETLRESERDATGDPAAREPGPEATGGPGRAGLGSGTPDATSAAGSGPAGSGPTGFGSASPGPVGASAAGTGSVGVPAAGARAADAGAAGAAGAPAPPGSGRVGDRTGFRLAAFGALLVVVLFAGYGIGRLNGGTVAASAPTTSATGAAAGAGAMPGMVMDENQPHTHNADGTVTQGGTTQSMGAAVGGLSLSSGGLTLVPSTTTFPAGQRRRLAFRIVGAGGAPVTTYAVVHDKPLHLVVIRRDLGGFQHLHPGMAPDGTWSIDLTLAEPGSYRMIADFTAVVGGQPVATILGSDLTVAGDYAPRSLPDPATTAGGDGFTATWDGTLSATATQPMLIGVAGADGGPATLEPYLGAYGHLVVLRAGDVASVHVHPEAKLVDGKVKFWLALPSAGTYRMFFDYQVAGRVHTAAWTAELKG